MSSSASQHISVVFDKRSLFVLPVNKNDPGLGSGIEIDLAGVIADPKAADAEKILTYLKEIARDLVSEKVEVCLGVADKDLILRSFVMPYMAQDDLDKAIIFEIKRHIPFELSDLYYVTMTFPFVEANDRVMRVVFYGARKQAVDQYKGLCAEAGIVVTRCEPLVTGLARAMVFRKDISAQDKLALVDIDERRARVVFIDGGVVKFMREFLLPAKADPVTGQAVSSKGLHARLCNEVRSSIDHYTRQFNEEVKTLLVVGDDQWFAALQEGFTPLEVACRKYAYAFSAGTKDIPGSVVGGAFGLSLSAQPSAPAVNFLALHRPAVTGITAVIRKFLRDIREYEFLFPLAAGAIVLLAALWTGLGFVQMGIKKELKALTARQAKFAAMTPDELKKKTKKAQEDMQALKNISYQSRQHEVLVRLVAHMPEGVWLESLDLSYKGQGESMLIAIKGGVYDADVNNQTRAVNVFVSGVKEDPLLKSVASQWQLRSISPMRLKDIEASVFDLSAE